MKITEISKAIQNALSDNKFVGWFEVTIYHYDMKDIKISGLRDDIYPFNYKLKEEINEICFQIVSGTITDGDFAFDIKGQIEYLYTSGIEVEE